MGEDLVYDRSSLLTHCSTDTVTRVKAISSLGRGGVDIRTFILFSRIFGDPLFVLFFDGKSETKCLVQILVDFYYYVARTFGVHRGSQFALCHSSSSRVTGRLLPILVSCCHTLVNHICVMSERVLSTSLLHLSLIKSSL